MLTESLARIVATPDALDAFVASLPLDTELREQDDVRSAVLAFASQKRPVIHSYAREETEFPVWSIVLAGEEEGMRPLGDEGPDMDDDEHPESVALWDSTYKVLVYSKLPDLTVQLYHLLQQVLISRRQELRIRGGLTNLSKLSGAELAPDSVWLPQFLFVRAASLTVQEERRGLAFLGGVSGSAQPLPPARVTGLHVRDEQAPPDGVTHGVGVYLSEGA